MAIRERYLARERCLKILLYHRLEHQIQQDRRLNPEYTIYTASLEGFTKQMDYLRAHNYAVIPMHDLMRNTYPELISNEKVILLTFDDGHISNYALAYPILRKYSLEATFFVTAALIGLPGYLSWPQIREMSANGMGIGSHTLTHPDLSTLGPKEIRYELLKSKEILEDGLGQSVDFLSIPESRYNETIKQIAREVGYLGVCTGGWRPGYKYIDIYDLKRLGIKGYFSLSDFISLLEMRGKAVFWRHAELYLKSVIKKTLGRQSYQAIRERWFELKAKRMKRPSF